MSTNWVGPRRISRILMDFTVEIKHLLTSATAVLHVCRVKPYADASVGTPAQMQEVAEFMDRIWYFVDKIKDVRKSADHFEVLVAWKGLNAAGDSWEPLTVMFEDAQSNFRAIFKRRRLNPIFSATALLGVHRIPETGIERNPRKGEITTLLVDSQKQPEGGCRNQAEQADCNAWT